MGLGLYLFFQKRTAFRRDFCLSCEQEVYSVRVRAFQVAQVLWIPLIPLGFWERWWCLRCAGAPHHRMRTSRTMKFVGSGVAAVVALACAMGGADFESALIAAMVAGLFFWWAYRGNPVPVLAERLEGQSPWADDKCIFCSVELIKGPVLRCPTCEVVRVEAPGGDR